MARETLDLRGKICPVPLLLTKRKLESMSEGEILEVVGDYPQTRENILKLIERTRNEVLGVEEAKGTFKITIRKKALSQGEGNSDETDRACPSSS
nr:sulfurtransferase TusA family protein [Candidatus Njordarchaeota archaeon]